MSSRTSSPGGVPSRSMSATSLPPRQATPVVELPPVDKEKEALVFTACRDRDLDALIDLATRPSGLVSDAARCVAWPLLLGCSPNNQESGSWKELPTHKDEHQVGLDVNRAFVYYPKNESDKQLGRRKEELSNVIVATLRRHPVLRYFQGYHDIIQVLLLVLGHDKAHDAAARLSLLRIRDFMLPSFSAAVAQLQLLRPIFHAADPELYEHLPKDQHTFPIADTITMFAHNIQDYKDITRLFDFFLARDAVMPIYLFAAVVLSRRDELLEIDKEDEDILHVMLGKLPQPFDVEFFIQRTFELYERLPPASLGSWEWWKICSASVLKASPTVADLNRLTLEDGERFFAEHARYLQREQAIARAQAKALYLKKRLWYYRRYGYVGLAVLVGAYAVWLGRGGNTRYPIVGPVAETLRRFLGGPPR